jgi:pimeloyl-ACP methyl ester carboxylesterase
MSAPVVLIAGTWGIYEDVWWQARSPFAKMLGQAGLTLLDPVEPFTWSTELDGVHGENNTWYAAGLALVWYCHLKAPGVPVTLIGHSHGGQVGQYAAAHGLMIEDFVTIATPVRRDVQKAFTVGQGRAHISRWTHIHTDGQDYMQMLGSVFGGSAELQRDMPLADTNLLEPGQTHSGLLNPVLWAKRGWPKYAGAAA